MAIDKLTYGDFYRTGVQDCQNAVDLGDFDYDKGGTPREIVERAVAEWEEDGMKDQWLRQQDDFEGLDANECYASWLSGWKDRATSYVKHELERRTKRRADEDAIDNPPPNWWRRPAPAKDRPCYRTKVEALAKFLEVNYQIVENYGGADYEVSPSEFDAINHKYNLTGKKAVRSIAQAVWVAMPVGKPYCLDRIDLDALNDTSPARESDMLFVLPDSVYALQMAEQELQHYAPVVDIADIPEPDWVTEHVKFPPVPAMPEGPIRTRLQKRESDSGSRGVETYQMLPPLPPLEPIRPVNVELESQEGSVSTFKFNPGRRNEWGYDLTRFKPGGFAKLLCELKIEPVPTKLRIDPTLVSFAWKGPGVEIVTSQNPLTGEAGSLGGSRKLDFAGYMGLRGRKAQFQKAKRLIERHTDYQKDQGGSRGLDYIDFEGRAELPPVENPAWVTNILAKHFEKLEDEIPSKWLPKLTRPTASRGKMTAALKEYGCGAYGCVLPTLDKNVVLKLTTDVTEAEFAAQFADKLSAPVVVKYHVVRELPEKHKRRPTFLLWRDSAEHVDKVEQTIAEEGGTDPLVVEDAIAAQHKAAQDAFDALVDGEDATKLMQTWEDACREMGLLVPELSELAEGMITVLHNDKIFFGDVHGGNIGMVNGHWVIVDPGHVAVLEG